jgi:hypothetical protein
MLCKGIQGLMIGILLDIGGVESALPVVLPDDILALIESWPLNLGA